MIDQEQSTYKVKHNDFSHFTATINALSSQGNITIVESAIKDFLTEDHPISHKHLVLGFLSYLRKDFAACVQEMIKARDKLPESEYPDLNNPYSIAFLKAQVTLSKAGQETAAMISGQESYQENISALREIDSVLAREVDQSTWPPNLMLVDFWGGRFFFGTAKPVLCSMAPGLEKELSGYVTKRASISFGGVKTGQELLYCLHHKVNLLHGLTRAHYLFEPKAELIKAFFFLDDCSKALRNSELIIFGGSIMENRAKEIFNSFKYDMPYLTIGDINHIQGCVNAVTENFLKKQIPEIVKKYYASREFQDRKKLVAAGKLQPRVLVNTCRWTTFLKYCAADFEKAFAHLGCETRFFIEENDVQVKLPSLHWKELNEFKPDMIFMISHARPSISFLPRELPFIGFIQDKCGPLITLPDLKNHITREDLFICLSKEHKRFLMDKGVPANQTYIMPVPVDADKFFPLSSDNMRNQEFLVDTSFVKHGTPHFEKAFEQFLESTTGSIKNRNLKDNLAAIYKQLYKMTCFDLDNCYYESDIERIVLSMLKETPDDNVINLLKIHSAFFHGQVYSAAWRYQFLEALDEAGIELVLYGNNWLENQRLKHLSRGSVDREKELNFVYNFSRINLSIGHSISMTQRITECALSGGFVMAADHPIEKDGLPARNYFEPGKEIVLFKSKKEIVDLCRYYLEHKDERLQIAAKMHKRALRERTSIVGAESCLKIWRKLLAS